MCSLLVQEIPVFQNNNAYRIMTFKSSRSNMSITFFYSSAGISYICSTCSEKDIFFACYSTENKPHNTTVHDTTTLSRHIILSHHGLHLY